MNDVSGPARQALAEAMIQREEILRAFMAKYGAAPEQVVQEERRMPDGGTEWRVRFRSVMEAATSSGPAADRAAGWVYVAEPFPSIRESADGDGRACVVAEVHGHTEEQTHERGRLMAAAPELLVALTRLLAGFDQYDRAMQEIGRGPEDYGLQRANARALIERVTG